MIRLELAARRNAAVAERWGKKLATDVAAVMSAYPEADPEDVRLTLISLQSPPLERLNRSLRRGRGFAAANKLAANRPKDQRIIPVLQNTLRTLQTKSRRQPTAKSPKNRPRSRVKTGKRKKPQNW